LSGGTAESRLVGNGVLWMTRPAATQAAMPSWRWKNTGDLEPSRGLALVRRGAPGATPLLALIAGGLLLVAGCSKQVPAGVPSGPPPPVPVTVATVEKKTAPVEYRTFGTVQANLTAAIKSQVTGLLTKVHFQEGQNVKEGDLLFTIDPKPLEAALQQAEANLARDTAQQKNAEVEAARQLTLLKKGVTAQDEYDTARTNAEALAATMRADQAAIQNVKVQIAYCSIHAPIDGRMGQWLVHQGNLVKADDVTLAVINQVRPIQVSFAVPQRLLQTIQDEMPKHKLEVRAVISGQEDRPETGELTFVDNTVDPSTGTLMLKATLANTGERLWPGAFADVILTMREEPNAIVIPSRAIQTGQEGQYVFVVKEDKTAELRPITVERALNSDSVISKGLEAGEMVVTDGQLRLVSGARTMIKAAPEESQPKAGAEPTTAKPKEAGSGKRKPAAKGAAKRSEGRQP
jgi:multidrug efflux system membrane fusion protein